MTDRQTKYPDERWEAVGKGQTRETKSGNEKNTTKPDNARVKGELTNSNRSPEADEIEADEEE